jgi:DNA invertase Pin-like site-specific DNA recombinase
MISKRTKEGIAAAQARGIFIGRPQGAKSKRIKLTGKFREIKSLLNQGVPKVQIARQMNVHRSTLHRLLMDREAV